MSQVALIIIETLVTSNYHYLPTYLILNNFRQSYGSVGLHFISYFCHIMDGQNVCVPSFNGISTLSYLIFLLVEFLLLIIFVVASSDHMSSHSKYTMDSFFFNDGQIFSFLYICLHCSLISDLSMEFEGFQSARSCQF